MYGIEYPDENNLEDAVMIDTKLRERITKKDWDELGDSLIGEKKVIDVEKYKKELDETLRKSDPIVDKVLLKFATRSKLGITKYGTTLQDNNASLFEWLNHLQEELMDATLYIEKLKQLNK